MHSKGDVIEVIDLEYAPYPIRGTILKAEDNGPLSYPRYFIKVDSAASPAPKIWVSGRMAKKV